MDPLSHISNINLEAVRLPVVILWLFCGGSDKEDEERRQFQGQLFKYGKEGEKLLSRVELWLLKCVQWVSR